ncbi:hypothetical protein N7486_009323 [Penicillium sp. IBT 16267x]|nr:hypothetical protein N7486_009323 [Penicillium sp. IBT 16267x]
MDELPDLTLNRQLSAAPMEKDVPHSDERRLGNPTGWWSRTSIRLAEGSIFFPMERCEELKQLTKAERNVSNCPRRGDARRDL